MLPFWKALTNSIDQGQVSVGHKDSWLNRKNKSELLQYSNIVSFLFGQKKGVQEIKADTKAGDSNNI